MMVLELQPNIPKKSVFLGVNIQFENKMLKQIENM